MECFYNLPKISIDTESKIIMIQVGIFKIIFEREKINNKTRVKKKFIKVCEYTTDKQNQTMDFIKYKKMYRDWDFYFCDVPIGESYYYFNSSKNKIYID